MAASEVLLVSDFGFRASDFKRVAWPRVDLGVKISKILATENHSLDRAIPASLPDQSSTACRDHRRRNHYSAGPGLESQCCGVSRGTCGVSAGAIV